ncbi:DnaJ domain-containing protein [Oscillospiraceae bacterium CM]|nr:DnaJ domain-containing protein [Oscillospiraceae bacterium CM]
MMLSEDFYTILQVHFLAEPEVIESAYKRLAKKYHPDVSRVPGADSRMQKINEAYETLRDADKRCLYDRQRRPAREPGVHAPFKTADAEARTAGKKEDDAVPPGAREALRAYFDAITSRDFSGAYALITSADKKNISEDDFIRWQSCVSRVYALSAYMIAGAQAARAVAPDGRAAVLSVAFSVLTTEQNAIIGRIEKDTVVKKVLLEESAWHVAVGFDNVAPYIERFEALNGLLAAKSAISDMVEHYSQKDAATGLFNRKGFSEAAQREVWRYNRYGNVFSVLLLEVDVSDPSRSKNKALHSDAAEWAGKLLCQSFRNLDILGRWGETGFIILMPETRLSGCFEAAKKILSVFQSQKLVHNRKAYHVKLNIGIEEFNGSLEDTIRNLNTYIGAAGKTKRNCIVYFSGIYE